GHDKQLSRLKRQGNPTEDLVALARIAERHQIEDQRRAVSTRRHRWCDLLRPGKMLLERSIGGEGLAERAPGPDRLIHELVAKACHDPRGKDSAKRERTCDHQ